VKLSVINGESLVLSACECVLLRVLRLPMFVRRCCMFYSRITWPASVRCTYHSAVQWHIR